MAMCYPRVGWTLTQLRDNLTAANAWPFSVREPPSGGWRVDKRFLCAPGWGNIPMARIRTIKPEFWTSEQISECSVNARLLFIGLWNFSDDDGRHVASPKRLKMEVFPGDPFTLDEVRQWIDELIVQTLLIEYEAQGQSYWQVTGWHHQKINRAQPSKIPGPFTDGSVIIHSGREWKGMEGNGREDPPKSPQGDAGLPSVTDVHGFGEEIVKHWNAHCEAHKSLTPVRWLSAAREQRLRDAFAECPQFGELWHQALDKTPIKKDINGWQPTFDFLCDVTGVLKVLEGQYDEKLREGESHKERIARILSRLDSHKEQDS